MPASGQLWSTRFQIGKETTAGVGVAATRVMYFNPDGTLTRTRAPREHRFAVGRRDNVLAYTNGPIEAAGSIGMPMSADEILELLAISVQGGVTPTTPTGATAGRKWVFKPSNTVDSVTLEWDDAARSWRALAERVPTFMEGWQTILYADPFGSAPGQSQIPSFLRNWNIPLSNQLGRLYLAGNTLATNRITQGELQASGTLTIDAASAQAATEFANWDAGTKRTIRLEFLGPRAEFEAAINEVQTLTTTGTPAGGTFTLVVLGQTTATIAFNAAAATVQTAINNALAVLGSTYTVTCTGGPLPTGVVITFDGAGVAGRDIPLITLGTNALTGGTTPTINVAATTAGYYGGRIVQVDIPGAWTAFDLSGNQDNVRTYDCTFQAVYEPTVLAAMIQYTCYNNRSSLY
jgi:hypothetical protein